MNYLEQELLDAGIRNAELKGESLEIEKMFIVVNALGLKLQKDGNQWCYVYGNLPEPDCIAGFGDSPKSALYAFYKEWACTP